jgi:hypothetical protein
MHESLTTLRQVLGELAASCVCMLGVLIRFDLRDMSGNGGVHRPSSRGDGPVWGGSRRDFDVRAGRGTSVAASRAGAVGDASVSSVTHNSSSSVLHPPPSY